MSQIFIINQDFMPDKEPFSVEKNIQNTLEIGELQKRVNTIKRESREEVQRTVVIIKSDGMEKNITFKVAAMFEEQGLKLVDCYIEMLTEEILKEHYSHHVNKSFFPEILQYMLRAELFIILFEGKGAIALAREISGSTDPKEALEGTVRALYGKSKAENVVHSSENEEAAGDEEKRFFPKKSKMDAIFACV